METEEKQPLRILTIGDPHFKEKNVEQTRQMVTSLINLAKDSKPDLIVCLGDTLDRHARIHVDPLCDAVEMFEQLVDIAPLVIIIGNHDRRNNSDFQTSRHPFTALKRWPRTYVVDSVRTLSLDGHLLVFAPYVPNGRFIEALNSYDPKTGIANIADKSQGNPFETDEQPTSKLTLSVKKDTQTPDNSIDIDDTDYTDTWWWRSSIIFGHQEIRGAKMGAIISQKGDIWPNDAPLLVTGHIHDYQWPQKNVGYPGTPMQHAFGDSDNKGISIFHWTEVDGWKEDRHDLGLLKKKLVYLKASQLHNWLPPDGYLVKVTVEGTAGEIKALNVTDKIKELKSRGILIKYKTLAEKSLVSKTSSRYQPQNYLTSLYVAIKSHHMDNKDILSRLSDWYVKIYGNTPSDVDGNLIIGSILDYLKADTFPAWNGSTVLRSDDSTTVDRLEIGGNDNQQSSECALTSTRLTLLLSSKPESSNSTSQAVTSSKHSNASDPAPVNLTTYHSNNSHLKSVSDLDRSFSSLTIQSPHSQPKPSLTLNVNQK